MTQKFKLMIAGETNPTGTIELVAPFDRTPIATIETCGMEGMEQALATAYKMFQDRSRWLPAEQPGVSAI